MAAVSITLAYFLALAGVAFASTAEPVLMFKPLTGKGTYDDTKVDCKRFGEDFHIPKYAEDDQRIVIDAMKENVPEAWISVRRTRYPMWKWLDDVPVDHNFAQQDWKQHMNCGVLHLRDNVVEVDNCTYRDFGFVCELPAGKDCLGIGVQETNCRRVDGRTFVLTCSSENWYDAQYQCRKNGMELAVVRSGKIQADLSQNWYRQTKECSQVWIGLRREDWSYESPDDKQIVHYHWAPGQPSMVGDCAIVYKTPQKWHLWKSANCISQQGRICVRRLAPLTTQATNPPVTSVSEFPQRLNPPQEQSGSSNLGLAVGIPILLLAVGVIAAVAFLYIRRRNRNPPMKVEDGTDSAVKHPLLNDGKEDGASMASSFESLNEPYVSSGQIVLEAVQEFGNGGGRLVIVDSDVTLDVPQGAVPRNKTYTIKARVFGEVNVPSLKLPRGDQDKVISPLVDMTSSGKFDEPVILSIPHKLPPGELQEKITVYYRQNPSEKWKKAGTRYIEMAPRLPGVYFKVSPKAVIVDTKHFTQFICTCKGDTRSLGLTGVLFAKYRDSGSDPMEQEIQLNVFVMEAVHSTRENLKALECEVAQHGTHQRMNMQIDLSQEDLNGLDQLHIRMATQEQGWNYVTGTEKTKSLYDIASCHKPQLWVLAGEFVLQREAPYKEALDGTRIIVTFLVERKSGTTTTKETKYTHFIPFNKRQKRRGPKKKTEETNQTDIQQAATPMPKDKERKDENIDVKPEDMPAEQKVSESQGTEKQQVSENVTEKQEPSPTEIGHPVEETKQSPVAEVRNPFMITKTEEEKAATTEVNNPQKSQVLEKGDLDPSAEKQDAELGLEATEEIKPQDNFYSAEEQKEVVMEDPEKERLLTPDPTQGIPPTEAGIIQKVEEELAKENEKSGEGQNVTSTDEVDSTQKETLGKEEGKPKKKGRLAALGLKKEKKKEKGKE